MITNNYTLHFCSCINKLFELNKRKFVLIRLNNCISIGCIELFKFEQTNFCFNDFCHFRLADELFIFNPFSFSFVFQNNIHCVMITAITKKKLLCWETWKIHYQAVVLTTGRKSSSSFIISCSDCGGGNGICYLLLSKNDTFVVFVPELY